MEALGQAILWFGNHPRAVTWLVWAGIIAVLFVVLPIAAGLLVQAGREPLAPRRKGLE